MFIMNVEVKDQQIALLASVHNYVLQLLKAWS